MAETATSELRLLIVDDDRLLCWALEQEFSGDDVTVSLCHDGQGARRRLEATNYDLAILDVHLPDANGIAILEEIRRHSPGTRVIVVTADASPAGIRRAIAAGAELFVEKPFDPSMIRGRVLGMFRSYPVPRRHPRYICRFPVRFSLLAPLPPAPAPDGETLSGIAEDVGSGGIGVVTGHALAAGQTLRLTVGDAGAADPFLPLIPPRATATVRWTAAAPGGLRAGLSFTESPGLHAESDSRVTPGP